MVSFILYPKLFNNLRIIITGHTTWGWSIFVLDLSGAYVKDVTYVKSFILVAYIIQLIWIQCPLMWTLKVAVMVMNKLFISISPHRMDAECNVRWWSTRTLPHNTQDSFGHVQNYVTYAFTQVIRHQYTSHRSHIGRVRDEYAMCSFGINYVLIRRSPETHTSAYEPRIPDVYIPYLQRTLKHIANGDALHKLVPFTLRPGSALNFFVTYEKRTDSVRTA